VNRIVNSTFACNIVLSFFSAAAVAADPPPSPASGPLQLAVDDTATAKTLSEPAPPAVSDAEKIARLQRAIEIDDARLKSLTEAIADPASTYAKAEADFQKLDDDLSAAKQMLQKAVEKGGADEAKMLERQNADLTKRWNLAKESFQLEIEQRKTQQAVIATLDTKIKKDREALAKLKGTEPIKPADDPASALPGTVPAAPAAVVPPSTASNPAASTTVAPPEASLASPATVQAVTETPAAPATPLSPAPSSPATPPTAGDAASAAQPPTTEANLAGVAGTLLKPKPDPKALSAATQAATKTAEEAAQAEQEAASVTERLELFKSSIVLQRQLKEFGRKKVDTAEDVLHELNDELTKRLAAGKSIEGLADQIGEAQDRLRAAKIESRGYSTRLDELQTELTGLQEEQISAWNEAEAKRKEAEQAQSAVDQLNNPFSTRNLLWWLGRHGTAVLIIISVVTLVLHLSRKLEGRFISLLAGRSRRGGHDERTNRARTLVTVLQNLVRTVAVAVGLFMALDEIGLPIGPLLGGAAVIGLAVAFGAQSLIKDYFTGFMVLMEQQYVINDVIKIGDVTAQVERITLRMTVLRDLEGRVHFIPHGQIDKVTNLTHGWSRAVFDISVAYKEDIDRVIAELTTLAGQLARDPHFGPMILDEPQMLGVDSLADSAVIVKFGIKTRPLRQWDIKREMLRRIKKRFDELKIEIPFPHQTLYLRTDEVTQEHAKIFRPPHSKSA
jgi:moderate conductance mechanosensitive channel